MFLCVPGTQLWCVPHLRSARGGAGFSDPGRAKRHPDAPGLEPETALTVTHAFCWRFPLGRRPALGLLAGWQASWLWLGTSVPPHVPARGSSQHGGWLPRQSEQGGAAGLLESSVEEKPHAIAPAA